jgi:glycogen operon protein
MICHGDELGRTQGGNNNGYCQDNEITWIDWDSADQELLGFTARLAALRAEHPVFRRRRFFNGRPVRQRGSSGVPDISWFRPDGSEMNDEDWDSGFGKSVAIFLNGHGIPDLDTRGQRVVDDSFVVCFNGHHEPIEFTLPPAEFGEAWVPVVDTATAGDPDEENIAAGTARKVAGRFGTGAAAGALGLALALGRDDAARQRQRKVA